MSTVVDLTSQALDVTRLPLRRRVPPAAVVGLVGADPLLEPLRAPEIVCDVEVTAPRPDGEPGRARLRCRHGLRGDRVASTAWAGGAVEVAAYGAEHWQTELARAADVPLPAGARPPQEEVVEVPLETLLATGEALRTGRVDLLDELVRRAEPDDPARLREQVVRLHAESTGRLLATVARRDGGTSRVGWVTWLLLPDGWRSLTPVLRLGRPTVRLAPTTRMDLGADVAALVALLGGRR